MVLAGQGGAWDLPGVVGGIVYVLSIISRMAQWKLDGPITRRSMDRNHLLLSFFPRFLFSPFIQSLVFSTRLVDSLFPLQLLRRHNMEEIDAMDCIFLLHGMYL